MQLLGVLFNSVGDLCSQVDGRLKMCLNHHEVHGPIFSVGDCQDALSYFHPVSGVYSISPPPLTQPFDVFCDMDGQRGWTVIQVRGLCVNSRV